MSNAGQNNIKGINSQTAAAFSLFLQFFNTPGFNYICLEPDLFHDFNLVFNDRKIICESKDRKGNFSFSQLKEVLDPLAERGGVSEKDEILIICTNVSDNFVLKINKTRYSDKERAYFSKNKGYSDSVIALLPRVKFWNINVKTEDIIYDQFNGLIDFWLPESDIEKIVDTLLMKFNRGSELELKYYKDDFLNKIKEESDKIRKNSVYYNEKYQEKEAQFLALESALDNLENPMFDSEKELTALSGQRDLFFFLLIKLRGRSDLVLSKLDKIWKLGKVPYLGFNIFQIFQDNLTSEENKTYILEYFEFYIRRVRDCFYRFGCYIVNITGILELILTQDDVGSYLRNIFLIVKLFLDYDKEYLLYSKTINQDNDYWEENKSAELLLNIYRNQNSDDDFKKEIVDFIFARFSLIKDQGGYGKFLPRELMRVVLEWISGDFLGRFNIAVKKIIDQYIAEYEKFGKNKFDGWDLDSGRIASFNGNYEITDHHFIIFILYPAIKEFYKYSQNEAWNFIKENCIIVENNVSKNKPDFLNRSVYKIVLERYFSNDVAISNEAYNILKNFILPSNGLSCKTNLICQFLFLLSASPECTSAEANSFEMKKSNLLELMLADEMLSRNVFVNKIISSLAQEGSEKAKNQLKRWFEDSSYLTIPLFSQTYISMIRDQIAVDLDYAIDLIKIMLTREYAISNRFSDFSPYLMAGLIRDILRKNYQKGLSILREIEFTMKTSENYQIIYTASLFDHQINSADQDEDLLRKIYMDLVCPFLEKHNYNLQSILEKLRSTCARGLFVQFSTFLAKKNMIKESLIIVNIFICDPDPIDQLDNIEARVIPNMLMTVRGSCGFSLINCVCLAGREYLLEIIELTNRLINDKNYYVVNMSCFVLEQLMRNRFSTLSEKSDKLFFNDNIAIAVQMIEEVEFIALNLLEKFSSFPLAAQEIMVEAVLEVFKYFVSLNQDDAHRLIAIFKKLSNSAVGLFLPWLFHYAELKAIECSQRQALGIYGKPDSSIADHASFKDELQNLIQGLQKNDSVHCRPFIVYLCQNVFGICCQTKNKYNLENILIRYLSLLANVHDRFIFDNIFHAIANSFHFDFFDRDAWVFLFLNMLNAQQSFVKESQERGANLYHAGILESIFNKMGASKFLEAFEVLCPFIDGIMIHEKDRILSIIKELAIKESPLRDGAVNLIHLLVKNNPGEYLELKKSLKTSEIIT